MTRKQMKKLAKELYECEQIHSNPSSNKEEKIRAGDRIMQLTNQIITSKDGLSTMLEIDILVQELINKKIGE